MGTDKRERQKAGRQARIEQEFAAAKRQRSFRTIRNLVIVAVVVLGGAFAYSSLKGGDSSDAKEKDKGSAYSNPTLAKQVLKRGKPKDTAAPPANTPANALEKKTLIEGKGKAGTANDGYVVEYIGKKPDGSVLDESWSKQPFPIAGPLGQAQLIQGWKEGLVGAKIGERRHLVIGADKAYHDKVPLAFDIDVVDIKRGK